MVLTRTVSLLLRIGEFAFACVVAGLIGEYLHQLDEANVWPQSKFIYTEVVAGLAIVAALLWLVPFTAHVTNWPGDLIFFILWIVAFALLVPVVSTMNCGSIWAWGHLTDSKSTCEKWKAAVAFTFLSAIFWLASAIIGFWFLHRGTRTTTTDGVHRRRGWYGRRRI